jgi:hypothetical protein
VNPYPLGSNLLTVNPYRYLSPKAIANANIRREPKRCVTKSNREKKFSILEATQANELLEGGQVIGNVVWVGSELL